jgi:hypothetical protein|tara:strand:+ start:2513 stop:2689 length:177 start_codon:yes stop_codon:yes gene_type:complete
MQDKQEKKSFERSGSTRKQIRFEDELLDQIETDRQSTSETFSEWVKDACAKKLNRPTD